MLGDFQETNTECIGNTIDYSHFFFFVTPPILAIKKKNLEEDANSSDELTKDS